LEFIWFGLTLIGVAIFHQRALWVSLVGLVGTIAYKLAFSGFIADSGQIAT
jgi:hypothetical protein